MGIQERKEREREELRRKIIRTASELVSEEGHENLTIRKLARQIEYSPRTIYLYFQDKEHLLHEIVEEDFRRTLELRREEASRFSQGEGQDKEGQHNKGEDREKPAAFLERRLRSHIESALADPNFYRAVVTLLFEKSFEAGPAQREIIQETREELRALFSGEKRSEKEIHAISIIIFSTIRGFSLALLNARGHLEKNELEELIQYYITFVRKGIEGGTT